jgi:quercetin dioxygenase-like cupin family protein
MRALGSAALGMMALSALCASTWCTGVIAQEKLSGKELPQRSEISGITPEVLVRTDVPGAPGKIEIVTRTTYQPGAELRRHYHTSQIVFYILEGSMGVQEDGKEQVALKPGDTLLIKPGTVHRHWNLSRMAPLIFTECVLVDEGQRSAVFVE